MVNGTKPPILDFSAVARDVLFMMSVGLMVLAAAAVLAFFTLFGLPPPL